MQPQIFIKDTKNRKTLGKIDKWVSGDWHNYSWRNSWDDCSKI